VYQREDWEDEPSQVSEAYDVYSAEQIARKKDAQRLTKMTVRIFRDEEERITGLTRDGEMSLSVLLVQGDGRLLDGQSLGALEERYRAEILNMNIVPVPANWRKGPLDGAVMTTEGPLAGCYQLEVSDSSLGVWRTSDGRILYSSEFGLEKHSGGVTPPE